MDKISSVLTSAGDKIESPREEDPAADKKEKVKSPNAEDKTVKEPNGAKKSSRVQQIKKERENKITVLYEEYIHLKEVRKSWTESITENPRIEPCFKAGMQGVELAFTLLAHFIEDPRDYVVLRPRIDMVAEDIQSQFRLVSEIVENELEDDNIEGLILGSLTQPFPFENAPPTTPQRSTDKASQSPGLDLVIDAVEKALPRLGEPEKQSIRKMIRNITGTFQLSFRDWTVGVGMEEQLSRLLELVGLRPFQESFGRKYLDYAALVQPQVIVDALQNVDYRHNEDFFFRAVHLGTECWCFVIKSRLQSAMMQIRENGHWHNAAAHVRGAAGIFEYLGSHVMMLTSMVLRDYLILKVEIEGTSGAGSLAVKELRTLVESLFAPLKESLVGDNPKTSEEGVNDLFLALYRAPERSPGRYNYAKALEAIESSVLGGFFFKHFLLASNVIGSTAKGTMNMAVQGLKKTYEKQLFPVLDFVRAELGRKMDEELIEHKGKIMNEIEEKLSSEGHDARTKPLHKGTEIVKTHSQTLNALEVSRVTLYSDLKTPDVFQKALEAELCKAPKLLAFLDHAWGKVAPQAGVAMAKRLYALYQIGNPYWDALYGEIMPEAAEHITHLLKADPSCSVEFGHNSHELFFKLFSIKLEQVIKGNSKTVRILTSDTEFYSLTRQLNRMSKFDCIEITAVKAEPSETFAARCIEAATSSKHGFDFVMVSQCTYLTQATLIPDIQDFLQSMRAALPLVGPDTDPVCNPLIIVDGYHSFGALPIEVGLLPPCTFFLSGVLKHVASGPNCAFILVPPSIELKPLVTGWLADPTVLGPESEGVGLGMVANYFPGLALQGSTPAFGNALLLFNETMRRWKEGGLSVDFAHRHVVSLQETFLSNLATSGPLSCSTLVNPSPPEVRSHTISFNVGDTSLTKKLVETLASDHNIEVDARRGFLRVGFGLNHNSDDVDKLIHAVKDVSEKCS